MPPGRVRVTRNEIDAPFCKGDDSDDWVKRRRRCTHFAMIKLTIKHLWTTVIKYLNMEG